MSNNALNEVTKALAISSWKSQKKRFKAKGNTPHKLTYLYIPGPKTAY